MKYYVEIQSEEDLAFPWTDDRCVFMAWTFDQSRIEDCIKINDSYYATYESMELLEEKEFKYLSYQNLRGSSVENIVTAVIPAGEYGIRESSLTLEEIKQS